MFEDRPKGGPAELVFKNRKVEQAKEITNSFARLVRRLILNEGITNP